jgi:putative peptidoglycan binding protein
MAKATKELQTTQTQVAQQASKTAAELQSAQAQAAQYREELNRLKTYVAVTPPSPNPIWTPSVLGSSGSPSVSSEILGSRPAWSGPFTSPNTLGLSLPALARAGDRPAAPLAVGDKGEYVKRVQAKLTELGCYKGEITGTFDEPTSQAVTRFKKAAPLAVSWPSTSLSGITLGGVTMGTIATASTATGDVDYLTWFDLMESAFARHCS